MEVLEGISGAWRPGFPDNGCHGANQAKQAHISKISHKAFKWLKPLSPGLSHCGPPAPSLQIGIPVVPY